MIASVPRKPAALTEAELLNGWQGIDYSYQQLLLAGVLLSRRETFIVRSPLEEYMVRRGIDNALIESFLGNARRIAYFLIGHKDDTYAGDYLPPDTWSRWSAAGPTIGLVSSVLSHARYVPKAPPYKWRSLADPLVAGMEEFLKALEHSRSPWVELFAQLREFTTVLLPEIRDYDEMVAL